MPGRNELELETLEIMQDKIESLKEKLEKKLPEGYGLEIVNQPEEPETIESLLNRYMQLKEDVATNQDWHTYEMSQQFYSGHYLSGKEKRRLHRAKERRKNK